MLVHAQPAPARYRLVKHGAQCRSASAVRGFCAARRPGAGDRLGSSPEQARCGCMLQPDSRAGEESAQDWLYYASSAMDHGGRRSKVRSPRLARMGLADSPRVPNAPPGRIFGRADWSRSLNMRRSARIQMLLTDAFGGSGGIAKFNRDFLAALNACTAVERVHAFPRLITTPLSDI